MKKITFLCLIIFTITLQGQNELMSSVVEYFDGSDWNYISGSNYEYDSNDNLISRTELSWDFSTSKWRNSSKISYTYNGSNKLTNELYQNWNPANSMFENSFQNNYIYVGGIITELIDQEWENGAWKNDYKSTFDYNGALIDKAFSYTWDGQWDLEDRSTVTYNGNNRFNEILTEDWDGSAYVAGDRQLFTYDGNNKLSVSIYESWDGSGWVEEDRTLYTIDASGNRTKRTDIYDGTSYEVNYVYDTNSLMSNFAHPFKEKTGLDYIVEDYPYYNKILSANNGGTSLTTYNYDSALILGIEDFKIVDNNIKVFPNPTSGNITIESLKSIIKNVEIYNALGRKVFYTQETHFNIDNLSTGVYFMKMTSNDDAVYTRKIVRN